MEDFFLLSLDCFRANSSCICLCCDYLSIVCVMSAIILFPKMCDMYFIVFMNF